MSDYSLGIDIGGTFTDIVVYDSAGGRQFSRKELTTHDDPSRGVMAGVLRVLEDHGVPAGRIGRVVHATTLFTNALIERKGAVTGLITSEGFRDILEIGRERKYELYDLFIERPEPLAPRNLRAEVPERTRADGRISTPLDTCALEVAAARLRDEGAASIALVFLHSYANPANERLALEAIERRHPDLAVSASSQVAPEIREYERSSTTVVNAYVKPLASRYLSALSDKLHGAGIEAPLLLMLSNGGLTNVAEAKRVPVQLLESGPAAGALVAAWFGREDGARSGSASGADPGSESGGSNVLAFDMGGTTAKLSLIDDGAPLIAYAFEAARQKRFVEGSGFPVRISAIELIEIGAGGGSIARLDSIGLLKVGPDSAGSQPGPAAYGQGGTQPTVTDADFLLGYLNADFFAGGAMAVDMAAARRAAEGLAAQAGLSVEQLAWGIHDVVNESMASAARVHIAERGRDPRRYTLLATGGAGPVHAFYVAKKLGLKHLICPRAAGVASALGLLIAPARVDRVATVSAELDKADWPALEASWRRIEAEAKLVIAETDLPPDSARSRRLADMRCVGQAHELVVDLPDGPYSPDSRAAIRDAFGRAYEEKFTRPPPQVPVEILNIRISVSAPVPGAGVGADTESAAGRAALKGSRPVWFPESPGFRDTPVYDRYALGPGETFAGPAVVEERESTLIVGPGGRFEVMASGNILVTLP